MDLFGVNQCSCNLTSFLDELKFDDTLRDKLRGPPGQEGKPGSPGLTVSTERDLFYTDLGLISNIIYIF